MFRGSLVALVTPMQKNGAIDFRALQKLVDWHLEAGTDGLVILGTTGEAPTIESEERLHIIRQVVDQVQNRIPVIVGTGANCTKYSIELTRQAMKLGADAVLLVTPYYNKPTQEGMFQHFKSIADAVPIPQILYNVPSRTGCDVLPETVARLAKIPNIVGVKEAVADSERIIQLMSLKDELDLLSGDDSTAMEFMLAGGQGVISVAANVVPKAFQAFCEAALTQQRQIAEQCHQRLSPLFKTLFLESNPIPVKWALSQMNMISEGIRLPLTPLSEVHQEPLRKVMQQLGL